jgi:hypothetical protein
MSRNQAKNQLKNLGNPNKGFKIIKLGHFHTFNFFLSLMFF